MGSHEPSGFDRERYRALERVYQAAKAAYYVRTASGISTHSDDGELAEAIRAVRMLDSLHEENARQP